MMCIQIPKGKLPSQEIRCLIPLSRVPVLRQPSSYPYVYVQYFHITWPEHGQDTKKAEQSCAVILTPCSPENTICSGLVRKEKHFMLEGVVGFTDA